MDFFRRFMAGRYGSDQLNNALLILGIALIIVARILGWAWMNVFILALLCLCYFRMFSRNIQARYAENEKFMRWWRPVSNRIRGAQGRFADRKTHCYLSDDWKLLQQIKEGRYCRYRRQGCGAV